MTHDNKVETEVKIYVETLRITEQRLILAGAALTAPRVYERNIRYDDSINSLTSAARVLRLRQDTRTRLTLKEPATSTENNILSRPELEVEVSDFDTMHTILEHLGFHEAWIYEKHRTTYVLNDCEIVLDEMPYGKFVEIEGDPKKIEALVELLGLSDSPRILASYSAIFFQLKQILKLTIRDLTFENFRSIVVPPELITNIK
ncbi:MAG: class IV adenylate cyclase [Anaerolineae bacterium]|nr:class IV adenylate cyclase [Anaerolineae bacterium]